MKRSILRILFAYLAVNTALGLVKTKAQDITLSQFFSSGIYLNPALAGSHICPRIKLYYRDQWPSIPRAYLTSQVMFDMYSFRIESGLAFSYSHDSQGEGMLQTHRIQGVYSKNAKISENWNVAGGLMAGYVFQFLDWSKLQFADQLDFEHGFIGSTQAIPPESRLKHYPDFGVGVTFEHDERFFAGFSAHHLSRPNVGFYGEARNRLHIKFSGHIGYIFILQDSWNQRDWEKNATLTPVALFEMQGPYKQIIGGAYFSKQPFLGGLFMRHSIHNIDAIIAVFGFQQPQYAIRYSFDITVSPLTMVSSGGGHELSFTWFFRCPDPIKKRIKPIKCPSFLK